METLSFTSSSPLNTTSTSTHHGPPVPGLFILLSYCNDGDLEQFIKRRAGGDALRGGAEVGEVAEGIASKEERIRLFRLAHPASSASPLHSTKIYINTNINANSSTTSPSNTTSFNPVPPPPSLPRKSTPPSMTGPAIHLLRLDEILNLMTDVTKGLGWLHANGIGHGDFKVSQPFCRKYRFFSGGGGCES